MKISAFQSFRGKTKSFYKEIKWQDFFKIEDPEMITLRVIPDRTVDNKQNFKLMRALHELYQAPLARVGFGKWFIRYAPKARIWYDVVLTKDEIKFYFTVPSKWETYTKQKITGCWPRASVDIADQSELEIPMDNTKISELVYKRHNIFALRVDRAEDTQPLSAVMSVSRDMADGDLARLSICADPNHRLNWQDQAEQAHKQFAQGKTPQRRSISKRKALLSLGTTLEGAFQQIGDTILAILGHGEDDKPKAKQMDIDKREILIEGNLQRSTTSKRNEPTFSTRIRVASHSADENRREITSRALANSFVDVAGDNELEKVDVGKKATVRILCEINQHRLRLGSLTEMDTNIMSASELGKLAQIPGPGLQDDYADQLETIKQRQDGPPANVTQSGLYMGEVEQKNESIAFYKPINNHDDLCYLDLNIGVPGCGKTKGQAANTAVEAVLAGFSSVTIDPAKRELGAEIMAALPSEKYNHIDLSTMKIGLDYREADHASADNTILADTLLSFFEMDGTEYQTERFLYAAARGMQSRKIAEIQKILVDDLYRQSCIKVMAPGMNKDTLIEFGQYSPDRQRAIMAPILNRLSVILRTPYLAACMEEDHGLDFVDIMKERGRVTIIDIPAKAFPSERVRGILVNLISTKIDMAMRLREDEDTFPYFVIFDEPHQYLRSAKLWESAAVEARKYKVKYCWFMHSLEQLPSELAGILLDAGPHLHIYRSSERTYKSLKNFLAPYTLDDVIKMPRFYAINVMRVDKDTTRPFMARMALPPSERSKIKNAAK